MRPKLELTVKAPEPNHRVGEGYSRGWGFLVDRMREEVGRGNEAGPSPARAILLAALMPAAGLLMVAMLATSRYRFPNRLAWPVALATWVGAAAWCALVWALVAWAGLPMAHR